jgi:hypothetical protein
MPAASRHLPFLSRTVIGTIRSFKKTEAIKIRKARAITYYHGRQTSLIPQQLIVFGIFGAERRSPAVVVRYEDTTKQDK